MVSEMPFPYKKMTEEDFAAIRAVTRTALYNGFEVKGIYHGYRGLLNGEIETFRTENVSNIIQLGGTILKTARSKEFQTPEGPGRRSRTCSANTSTRSW